MPDRPTTAEPLAPFRSALRLGLIYLAVVLPLEFASHWAIDRWISDPAIYDIARVGADLAFIFGTGGVILYLAYRELRKRTEVEERQQTLLDQSLAGISLVQDGQLRFVNKRLAEILGYEPEELTDPSFENLDVVAPQDREMVAEALRQRLEEGIDDLRYRYTGLTQEGKEVRLEVYGRRVEWEEKPAVLSIHLDVTREEQLEEQVRRAQRMDSLGQLTGSVAHDFNNVLTVIMASLDLSEDHLDEDSPARQELKVAKESTREAQSLTRQLLSFSRRRMYQPQRTDLNELVRRNHPMLKRLSDAGAEVRMELADNLPAVEIDRSLFNQVLLNLISNANEAVEGDGEIRIRTRAEKRDSGLPPDVLLEVIDDGRGIDQEACNQVFEPFFTTRQEGTGLGLATVHGIVLQAKGEIGVDSAPGEGTTFRIRLTGSETEPEPWESAEDGLPKQERSKVLGNDDMTILVVEDEEAVRRVVIRALKRHGFNTVSAPDGKGAVAVAEEHRNQIELALIDAGLPDVNGVEVADRMKDIVPTNRVVYMSGHSDQEVVDRLARERSAGFLEKPFSVEELVDYIHSVLDRNRSDDGADDAA